MAALFGLGQMAGEKVEVHSLWELLLKPSETATCSLHTEPEGSPRAEHVPEKCRFQLAGQNVEQFLRSWRANLKSSYLA